MGPPGLKIEIQEGRCIMKCLIIDVVSPAIAEELGK